MDLNGFDACDKAKANGMALTIHEFMNCHMKKKVIPRLPDGTYADIKTPEIYSKQPSIKRAGSFGHCETHKSITQKPSEA